MITFITGTVYDIIVFLFFFSSFSVTPSLGPFPFSASYYLSFISLAVYTSGVS